MKNLLLLTFMLPAVANAQTHTEYEVMMKKFIEYNNEGDAKKIERLFNEDARATFVKHPFIPFSETDGKLYSFKYIGDDGTDPFVIRVFKVESARDTFAMAFSLDANGKFRTFRYKTS